MAATAPALRVRGAPLSGVTSREQEAAVDRFLELLARNNRGIVSWDLAHPDAAAELRALADDARHAVSRGAPSYEAWAPYLAACERFRAMASRGEHIP
jgi:hypothetical protein